MTNKQRQHWEFQRRRALKYAMAYGASPSKAREIAERASERLGSGRRRSLG